MQLRSTDQGQLDLFHARASVITPRDAQDLMSWPFFSLAKSRRVTPIDFRMGEVSIRVEATLEHGMATIWGADILIWAASQIIHARDRGLRTSHVMTATQHEKLTFISRATSICQNLLHDVGESAVVRVPTNKESFGLLPRASIHRRGWGRPRSHYLPVLPNRIEAHSSSRGAADFPDRRIPVLTAVLPFRRPA